MKIKIRWRSEDVIAFFGNIGLGGIALYQMMLRDIFHFSSDFLYVSSLLCVLTVVYAISKRRFRISDHKEFVLLIAFHCYMLFAGVFSYNPHGAFSYWINYSLDYIIIFCAIALLGLHKNTKLLILIISLGALAMMLMLLFVPAMRYGTTRLRLSADSNPNYLGLIYAFGIWMTAFKSKFSVVSFVLVVVESVLAAIAIIMTGSRKSLIILFIVVLFYLFNYLSNAKLGTKIIVIILIVAFGSFIINLLADYFFSFSIADRFSSSFSSATDEVRIEMYKNGINAFLHNPIFGYGYEGYRFYYGGITYSHSNIIEVLVNGGIIGSVLYWSAFVRILIKLINMRKKIKQMSNDGNELSSCNKQQVQICNFQVGMILVLVVALLALSFSLILIYTTIYQMYVALAISGAYIMEKKILRIGDCYYEQTT